MRVGRGFCGALLAALACGLLSVSSTGATTVKVGQLFTPNAGCGPYTFLQAGVGSGTSYTVPKSGVITSWSFQDAPHSTVSRLRLKVGRSAGSGMYKTVGSATAGTQKANSVNTYSTHIPVKAGDLIGIYTRGGGLCGEATSNGGDVLLSAAGNQMAGTTTSYDTLYYFKLPVSVKVALDCVVPNLKGETLKAAKKTLRANSCTLGKVTPKGQTTGTVKSQTPSAGKTLAPGSKVSVRLG
jgi:PASTA domain